MPHRLPGALCCALALLWLIGMAANALAETGVASWYGPESGSTMANGKHFYPDRVSCAHKTLPLGTRIRVTDLGTGRSITCIVTDRGPYIRGRIVDLSRGAARALGMRGLAHVRVEKLN